MNRKSLLREALPAATQAPTPLRANPKPTTSSASYDQGHDLQRSLSDRSGKVLALQQMHGNHAVRRMIAQGAVQRNPPGQNQQNPQQQNPQQQNPQQGGKLQQTAPILELIANTVAPIGEMSDTVKPYADMLGALSGSTTGSSDLTDPTKDDKVEKGLSVTGGLVGGGQLLSKGVEMFGSETAKTVGQFAGENLVPTVDLLSGGYKGGKAIYDWISVSTARAKAAELVKDATKQYPKLAGAADILIQIADYRIRLNKWDSSMGTMTAIGGGTSLLGASTLNPIAFGTGMTMGLGSKILGSDLLWKGLQYLTGERVWSSERYNEEIKKLEGNLIGMIDDLVLQKNSGPRLLGQLYIAAKGISAEFAEKLKDKAQSAGRINKKNKDLFN